MEESESRNCIIFDGACGFCNASALWVAKHDVHNRFVLVSNQSDFGKQLLDEHHLRRLSPNSIVLIQGKDLVFTKSRAIQKILKSITGYTFLKGLMKVTPLFLQNLVYDGIARFRKLIPMGKSCEIPDPDIRSKFRL